MSSTGCRAMALPVALLVALLAAGCGVFGDDDGETTGEAGTGAASDVGTGAASDGGDRIAPTEVFRFETVDEWEGAEAFGSTFGIELPASATDIHALQGGFQDPYYQVRFDVDPTDLAGFESSPGCGGLSAPEDGAGAGLGAVEAPDWWRPTAAGTVRRCAGRSSGSAAVSALVDLDDPDRPVVYIWAVLT